MDIKKILRNSGIAGLILASSVSLTSCNKKPSGNETPAQITRNEKTFKYEGTSWVVSNEIGQIIDKNITQSRKVINPGFIWDDAITENNYWVLLQVPAGSKGFDNCKGLEGISVIGKEQWYKTSEGKYSQIAIGSKFSVGLSLLCDIYSEGQEKYYVLKKENNTRLEDTFSYLSTK